MDDQQEVQRLGELLAMIPAMHARLQDLRELGPAPGSLAITDLEVAGDGELIRSAAVTTLGNALDHLLAWGGLVYEVHLLLVYAPYTLLRSAVENASTARWLVDPKAGPRLRVARGIGYLISDLTERKRIEQIPWPDSAPPRPVRSATWQPAIERIRALEDRAAAAGLCPVRFTHTELVDRFGPGEFAYRLLSAFAHGGQAIPFAASDRDEADPADAGGLHTVRVTVNAKLLADVTDAALRLVQVALAEVFAYHGHDATPASPAE